MAVFTGGSLLIGGVGRPDLVEPALTERLAPAQHASAHRLADALHDDVQVLPTHGFGNFCASSPPTDEAGTIGQERRNNEAFTLGTDAFVSQLLAGLDDVPAYYARVGALMRPAPMCAATPSGRRHVEGSVHIPVHELQGRMADVPPGLVWVHCATGLRATIGASLLEATGRDVVTLDDSLEAAESAGLMVAG